MDRLEYRLNAHVAALITNQHNHRISAHDWLIEGIRMNRAAGNLDPILFCRKLGRNSRCAVRQICLIVCDVVVGNSRTAAILDESNTIVVNALARVRQSNRCQVALQILPLNIRVSVVLESRHVGLEGLGFFTGRIANSQLKAPTAGLTVFSKYVIRNCCRIVDPARVPHCRILGIVNYETLLGKCSSAVGCFGLIFDVYAHRLPCVNQVLLVQRHNLTSRSHIFQIEIGQRNFGISWLRGKLYFIKIILCNVLGHQSNMLVTRRISSIHRANATMGE